MLTRFIFVRIASKGLSISSEDINRISTLNQGGVHYVARRYFSKNRQDIEYADLVQAGNVGLVKAIHRYDVNNEHGASFYTYSFYWIKAEIQQYKQRMESLIRLPVRV